MTNDPIMFFARYQLAIGVAIGTIDHIQLQNAYVILRDARRIFVCGNGGSAAIAEHFSCDHMKGVRTSTDAEPEVISLSSNMALLTAIANDFDYEQVFREQLKMHKLNEDDALVVISSSGNSPNIVQALHHAKFVGAKTIGMVGFKGGLVKWMKPDALLWIQAENYGVVEDCHQILMHSLAQCLRLNSLTTPREQVVL